MKKGHKPPTICFAVPFFPKYLPGGAEIQSFFVAQHMLQRGWSIHFTTEDCGQPTGKIENENGIWVHKFRRTRFFNPVKCWSFYRGLVRMHADIYYQRGGTEYTFVTALAARSLGSRFVWATSSFPDCEGNKFRRSLRDEKARGIKGLILRLDAGLRDLLTSFGRKRADVVVVQSEGQKTRVREALGEEAIIIKTGHPIPNSPLQKASPPVVVWIANVKKLKRPEMFIKLAAECADLPATFLLVGGCMDPAYRRQLRQLSRGLTNLELAGGVPFSETNRLLAAASVLVNTSTREGFPNTFVQAWMRGTPVVSLSVDPDDILVRQRIGFCSKTFPQMVRDVRRLITDPSLRNEMGVRAKAYAIREHNLVETLRQYADLFEALYHESRMV